MGLWALAAGALPPVDSAGRWVRVSAMSTPRAHHSATALADGRVLVAGGRGEQGPGELSTYELFDGRTLRWSRPNRLPRGRVGHEATALLDGRVLFTGGSAYQVGDGGTRFLPVGEVDVFSPAPGTFTPSAPLLEARYGHSATLLSDGRVLVAGGARGARALLSSTELFDPRAMSFSPGPPLARPRTGHRAVLLADGRVLLAGGKVLSEAGAVEVTATAELFDPRTGTFGPAPPMSEPRLHHALVLLSDGRVLATGGATGEGSTNTAELWKEASGWSLAEMSLPLALHAHAAARLLDGRVLVVGGEPDDGVDTARALAFEPSPERWCELRAAPLGKKYHRLAVLADGRVLATGGWSRGSVDASALLYEPVKPESCEEPQVRLKWR